MDYAAAVKNEQVSLADRRARAYIAKYARGRTNHKLLRKSTCRPLCERIRAGDRPLRVTRVSDSAPVMEVELAARNRIGWRGKHTLLLSREAGSWLFSWARSTPIWLYRSILRQSKHCGSCQKCIDVCPTQAIPRSVPRDAPALHLVLDHRAQERDPRRAACADRQAGLRLRRLPSGLSMESVRTDFRGTGFCGEDGLDRAQPWSSSSPGSESRIRERMRGSAIRRIGYERGYAILAWGSGNAPSLARIIAAR